MFFDLQHVWLLICKCFLFVLQELPDVPLFLSLHNLCATLKCTSPSAVIFRSAVINAGYRISGTHVNPLGLKTDAPMDIIWDIMRCWVRDLVSGIIAVSIRKDVSDIFGKGYKVLLGGMKFFKIINLSAKL